MPKGLMAKGKTSDESESQSVIPKGFNKWESGVHCPRENLLYCMPLNCGHVLKIQAASVFPLARGIPQSLMESCDFGREILPEEMEWKVVMESCDGDSPRGNGKL